MNRLRGFTLIELLVVIAIITLLLSILTPSLRLVMLKSKDLMCRHNLRQYTLAAEMYLQNNNDYYPVAWYSLFAESPSGWCQWHDGENFLDTREELAGPLWGYLEMQGIHLCPIFRQVAKEFGEMHPAHNPSIAIDPQYSYSMNALLGPNNNNPNDPDYQKTMKRSKVRRPRETFFFGEENMWVTPGLNGYVLNDNALVAIWSAEASLDTPPPFIDSFGFFHNSPRLDVYTGQSWADLEDKDIGHTYASFVDGHVRKVTPEETYRLSRP